MYFELVNQVHTGKVIWFFYPKYSYQINIYREKTYIKIYIWRESRCVIGACCDASPGVDGVVVAG